MINLKRSILNAFLISVMIVAWAGLASCSKSESYSELLKQEEHAVNWYLSQKQIELNVPEDSISFIVGKDAPFYKLDPDGYVYMQVISKGDTENKVEDGDLVYFRFTREDLKVLAQGETPTQVGNSDNLGITASDIGPSYFIFGNKYLTSSTQWGTGIQMPMKFFGYGCEVNLVLRSYYGFSQDQTYCIPYLVNVRYFKPEY